MSWTQYVRDHLLPRVAGFELLMAPYAIAHLKLSLFLQESGYEFDPNQRLKVYLTNTLDNAPCKSEFLFDEFIRFSQWRIQKTGMGILAFITNHGYLDNPTFRGMRRSLDQTFDEMYVLDLHGNSKKKEVAPDGSKDENVFDIQQGVAISLMVKLP